MTIQPYKHAKAFVQRHPSLAKIDPDPIMDLIVYIIVNKTPIPHLTVEEMRGAAVHHVPNSSFARMVAPLKKVIAGKTPEDSIKRFLCSYAAGLCEWDQRLLERITAPKLSFGKGEALNYAGDRTIEIGGVNVRINPLRGVAKTKARNEVIELDAKKQKLWDEVADIETEIKNLTAEAKRMSAEAIEVAALADEKNLQAEGTYDRPLWYYEELAAKASGETKDEANGEAEKTDE